MAIDLKILGWSATGLRCPDHDLSFVNGSNSVHKVSLVQMPNGTGKTTVLNLIRAALSGPRYWEQNSVTKLSFRKTQNTVSGRFELKLLYNIDKRLTIILNFDFTGDGDVTYNTVGPTGNNASFMPPMGLRQFLQPDFIDLLIFDGELAEQLLDHKSTNAQKAIEEVYQLYYLKNISEKINNYWNAKASSYNVSGSSNQLSRRKTKVETLNNRIKEVTESKQKTSDELKKIQREINELKKEFDAEVNKNTDNKVKIATAENLLAEASSKLIAKTKELADLIKNPAEINQQFANAIIGLKDNLDKAKLPGVAAREFFEELADEDNCICGRPIDEHVSISIRQNAKLYLGAEEVGVLNTMKSDIKARIIETEQPMGQQTVELIKQIVELQTNEAYQRQNLEIIKNEVSLEDPQVERIQRRLNELHSDEGRCKRELEKYEDILDDSDNSWNLEILQRRLKAAEKDFADASGTLTLKQKRDILMRILDNALNSSRSALSIEVCEKANQKIASLMPDNDIRIASIDKCLKLAGKDGGSVGETLTVGYAFLSSLLFNSNHQLPCVIDSPANPIDLAVRPQVAKLIPNISNQFIAFTISAERPGFLKHLLEACKGHVHLTTLFRKKNPDLISGAMKEPGFKETEDGIWVEGLNYFQSFHSDNE